MSETWRTESMARRRGVELLSLVILVSCSSNSGTSDPVVDVTADHGGGLDADAISVDHRSSPDLIPADVLETAAPDGLDGSADVAEVSLGDHFETGVDGQDTSLGDAVETIGDLGPDLPTHADTMETEQEAGYLPDIPELLDQFEMTPFDALGENTQWADLLDSVDEGADLLAEEVADTTLTDWVFDFLKDDVLMPMCQSDEICAEYDDGDLCNGLPVCVKGYCVHHPALKVVCPPIEEQCQVNVCNSLSGECFQTSSPNGIKCDDGNALTMLDLCLSGDCVGTNAVECLDDQVCDDYYECTEDLCVGGFCLHSPVVCEAPTDGDCQFATCVAGKGCVPKFYSSDDIAAYAENFNDGVAQGWKLADAQAQFIVEKTPTGANGLALDLAPEFAAQLSLPIMFLPAGNSLLAVRVEFGDPDTCGSLVLTVTVDDEAVGEVSGCAFLEDEGLTAGFAFGPTVMGEVQVGVLVENTGEEPLTLYLEQIRIEVHGGEECCVDLDQDFTADCQDNCTSLHNPDQADCDADGVGDLCDGDSDNDGVDNKYDFFDCDPGASFEVRLVADRDVSPVQPTALACGPDVDGCFVLDKAGTHLFTNLYAQPKFVVKLEGIGLGRSATICSGYLWVLDAGAKVVGYEIENPAAPVKAFEFVIPQEFFSLNQAVGCNQGDLVISGGQYLYVLELGGEAEQMFDVLEEVWAAEFTDEHYLVITRSPQQPFHFFLRIYDPGVDEAVLGLKTDTDEPTPTCQFEDMSFAYWGADAPDGGVWVGMSGCNKPLLQLRDPWHKYNGSSDLDGDGLIDLLDMDDDDDGVPDLDDYRPLDSLTQADEDGDGRGNFDDLDDDGDGRSDNYAGLGDVVVKPVDGLFPGGSKGLEVEAAGLLVLAEGGELLRYDWAGNATGSSQVPLPTADAIALNGEELLVHDFTWKGIGGFVGGTPATWIDSPEVALNMFSFFTELAADEDYLWAGLAATNLLYRLDRSGNVQMTVRLPASLKGVAAVEDQVFVLTALGDDESALLVLDQAGNAAGYFTMAVGGLSHLAALSATQLYALDVASEPPTVVEILLPAGYLDAALLPVEPAPMAFNEKVVVSPAIPAPGADLSVTVIWDTDELPNLTELLLCHRCGATGGYIPSQYCQPVDAPAGSFTVESLEDGDECAFELRTSTDVGGKVASRRVLAVVGLAGSGSAVWKVVGGMVSSSWKTALVPGFLSF